MKQLLLRVDDGVHARLSDRAKREHRSINAIANEILAVAANADPRSPRDRVRARAAALGVLAPGLASPSQVTTGAVDRDRAIQSTRGLGPVLDEILRDERDLL